MTAPLETPDVLTVSVFEFTRRAHASLQHVRAGGVVRILDVTRQRVIGWLGPDQPASVAAMPDDLAQLAAGHRARLSQAARSRREVARAG
jgi:hypothetical protein